MKITLNELRSLVKQVLREAKEKKTYSVYELQGGQPFYFWNEDKKSFTSDANKATLYTKSEAEDIMKKLLKPRIEKYQENGKNYKELHIGDLFKKNILKEK